MDSLLRTHRDKAAGCKFFVQAIKHDSAPEKVTVDKSGSNVAALKVINTQRTKRILVPQVEDLTDIVRQDQHAIKRRTRPMFSFKSFQWARILTYGIAFMHMINTGQMKKGNGRKTPAQQCDSLAA